jgi:hypothetical protein
MEITRGTTKYNRELGLPLPLLQVITIATLSIFKLFLDQILPILIKTFILDVALQVVV